VLVDLGSWSGVDDPAVGEHEDAVGQAEHLLDLAGHDDHGDAESARDLMRA
jgi:hypothetical protein